MPQDPVGPAQLLVNIEGARQKGAETLEQVHTVRARIEESGQTMDVLVKEVKRDGRLVRDDPYAQPVARMKRHGSGEKSMARGPGQTLT